MRRAFLIGLGLGVVLGTMWLVTLLAMLGKIAVYRSWVNLPPSLAMLILIGAIAGAVIMLVKLED